MEGHQECVGALAWSKSQLYSGSWDKSILQHDIRAQENHVSKLSGHNSEVNNRDISIAVLRAFISQRKQEHEAPTSRRRKTPAKLQETPSSEPKAPADSVNGTVNGNYEASEPPESCTILEKPLETQEKVRKELKPPRVLEALSASGLRALRYTREVEGIGKVVVVDNDPASVEACKRNIAFNGSAAAAKVDSKLADARVYMLTHPNEFDMICCCSERHECLGHECS